MTDKLPAQTGQEWAARDAFNLFTKDGFGCFLKQAIRPQAIGYSLLHSPIGLAACMLGHDTGSYYKMTRAFVDGHWSAASPGSASPTTSRCTG
ncbi:hypothetical protein [Micromonospora orduensis]|uniref:hypothetical protein n=1 Tax=Micromonospora orduensis TaxID=1420891 RepID=UPI003642F052